MSEYGKNIEKALLFAKKNGIIRLIDAVKEGIHPENLRRLCKKGLLTRISRGIYMPADIEPSQDIGLAQISKRVPHGVICLLSALQYHNIGT